MSIRRTSASPQTSGDCRLQLEALFAYLDGELSLARCRTIERHLANCPCCGALSAGVRRAIAICRAGGQRVPPDVRRKARAQARKVMRA